MIELNGSQKAFFVSDLHLSENTPKTLDAFTRWLASVSQPESLVFILGDLFEVWVGDDHETPIREQVAEAIDSAMLSGTQVYFQHGNRDFLIASGFADPIGMEILEDPEFLRIGGQIVLLSHGDALCVDDKPYQKFRRESRDEQWQTNFLSMPLEQRLKIASNIRAESTKHKSESAMEIMDVNQDAVANALKGRWPDGCYVGRSDLMIHGHTHRCAIHRNVLPVSANNTDEKPEQTADTQESIQGESSSGQLEKGMRIVLPDWRHDATQSGPKGGYLEIDAMGEYRFTVFNA